MATKINHKSFCGFIQNWYSKYRNWQKKRGRAKKNQKRLAEKKKFYSEFIEAGSLCFDIGANIGNRSEAFLELGAKVVAVEPQQSCIDVLKDKFGSNPNFILIDKAVSEKEGQQEFYISNANTLSSMSKEWIEFSGNEYFKQATWDEKTVVETTTMDKLISEFGAPQFCKIDVEGFELTVLKGLTRPLNMLSLEYTLGLMQPTLNCIKYLARFGPVQFNYSEGESMILKLPNWLELEEMVKLLQHLQSPVKAGDIYARFMKKKKKTDRNVI